MKTPDAPDVPLNGFQLYRRLLRYARPYSRAFFIAIGGMIVLALTEPVLASLIKQVMDGGFVDRNPELIRMIPVYFIGLAIIKGVAAFVSNYGMQWVGRKVIYDLRKEIFSRTLQLPSRFYDRQSTAGLVSRLIYDVEQVATAATGGLTTLVKDSITVTGLLIYMTVMSWKLTLLFMLPVPLMAFIVNYMSKKFRRISENIQDSVGDITQVAKDAFDGHKVVKSYGGLTQEETAFERVNNRNRLQIMKKAAVASAGMPGIEIIGVTALALVIYFSLIQSGPDTVTVGMFGSYLTAVLLMMGPIKRLTRVNESIQTGLAAATSIFSIIDANTETDAGQLHLQRAQGKVEFCDVSFRYDAKNDLVLDRLSFDIEPGQTVALVGPSGSGKSSIASLMARFYSPDAGEIRLDGVNIADYVLADLRQNISLVTQETVLFQGSIRDNIVYGSPDEIDEDRLNEAVHAAHVAEFADRLPDGLDTQVGERGARLSGGQRQRIAIARALYKDAPILIMDEATSALDTQSERLVQDAINALMKHRTSLVIAHRLSTIEQADKIIVLENGVILESGSHKDLLKNGGLYKRLHHLQQSES